jgi:hypothetical protein
MHQYSTWVITAIGGLYILFNMQKIRRLHIAVKILRSASKMTNLLFQIYFIPVMSAIVTGGFLYCMVMKTVSAYSSGEIIRTAAEGFPFKLGFFTKKQM